MNQDGALDVVIAGANACTVQLFLNQGNGTFREKLSHGAGVFPNAVAITDIDGNGRPDFAVAHDSIPFYATEGTRPESAVYLLPNQCIP